jgi:hemolysin III
LGADRFSHDADDLLAGDIGAAGGSSKGMNTRTQSRPEELANSLSHGAALLGALAAVPFLLGAANPAGQAPRTGAIIFALTMVLLYFTSTVYHALPDGRGKNFFLKLDHGAIFFFIAGSYTPFALATPNATPDWITLGLVWLLAVLGAALKISNKLSAPWLSTSLYLLMGWLVLVAAIPVVQHVSSDVMNLLLLGGAAYSVGVIFFALDVKVKYAHTVWHALVATGTACHFFAVLGCAV